MPITKSGESLLDPVEKSLALLATEGKTRAQHAQGLVEAALNPKDRARLHQASLHFLPKVRFAAAAAAEALEAPKTTYNTLKEKLL